MYLARLAAVLDRHDEALALFERADSQLATLGAPFLRSRNQVEWARLVGGETARRLLVDAADTAAAHGCAAVEERARSLLAAAGP